MPLLVLFSINHLVK